MTMKPSRVEGAPFSGPRGEGAEPEVRRLSRRAFLVQSGAGLGAAAFSSLLNAQERRDPLRPRRPAFPPRAKRVIYLHMVGAASQLDLFDYKPVLQKLDGQLLPDALWKGLRLAFIRQRPKLLGTRFAFARHGRSGLEVSELLPHLAGVVDELALIRSLKTEQFNHAPAQLMIQTGFGRFGRPSMGSWVTYGLGTENENLPGFVVLITGSVAGAGNSLWGSGFLPTVYQGIEFRGEGDPVLFLSNPKGVDAEARRRVVDAVNRLNAVQLADVGDPEIATRIAQYEMACRMQTSVPELADLSKEPREVLEMYGAQPGRSSFANNCLLARRLVERGVRFVQLYDEGWDMHGSVFSRLPVKCRQVDRPVAALLRDLKQRGLLDETLVVWTSEFGRTPMLQGDNGEGMGTEAGRDHHKDAFCAWMAGGGVKAGSVYGATDELGFNVVEDPLHVHDFNATILHLLGIDHEQLTFKYQGRAFRLTDVHGQVAEKLLA
jgi:hypothetical protein